MPIRGLKPHLDFRKTRIDKPLLGLVKVLAQAEPVMIVQNALRHFFPKTLQRPSEYADLRAVFHATPGSDAGPSSWLQHSECFLDLLLWVFDKHK